MREYGGYIEFETFSGEMLYEDGIALNCGRNALAYLCEAKKIRKLYIPYFLCASVSNLCKKMRVEYEYYHISAQFEPLFFGVLGNGEWLYVVNYYGQFSNDILEQWKKKYRYIIVDNAQSYFQMPVRDIDTLYTCRKYFGVADGAFLYTDAQIERELPLDESFERMDFLLGRFERSANEFYSLYTANNKLFANEPLKKMSKLTRNILHGVDYRRVKKVRNDNFTYFHTQFRDYNRIHLTIPEGSFMYPLYIENGAAIRKQLQQKQIYIPTLWSDVFEVCDEANLEYDMAKNILPLPVDQRYGEDDMKYIYTEVMRCITN
jgi:hypothetical protein